MLKRHGFFMCSYMPETLPIQLSRRKLKALGADSIKSAEAVNLVYVTDSQAGILRQKKGDSFSYSYLGKKVSDKEVLQRIRSLVIPPAWEKVWICVDANGHLQATGVDARNRKQYRYHPLWTTVRNHTKFYHLYEFGKVLPCIRKQLQKDLNRPELDKQKVLATVVMVMQQTGIRIGNNAYEKSNGTFGLTTLKDRHVKLQEGSVRFSFKGKKGIYHDIDLHSRKLARIVRQCRDIPGKELFQYYDAAGQRHSIDSGMVNDYIKKISEGPFTAKDFRTWIGTLYCLSAFREIGCCDTATETKKRVVQALDMVATKLGNTRAVCKKSYVHPLVIDLYSNGDLNKQFNKAGKTGVGTNTELSEDEHLLMHLLELSKSAVVV